MTKWVVVIGALGFAALGVFIAARPIRVMDYFSRMPGRELHYPLWYIRALGTVATLFSLTCAILAALFGHTP